MLVKIHDSYRRVIAICDAELVGKKFEEGKKQLDIKKEFFLGDKMSTETIIELMQTESDNNSTFNIVGKKAVSTAFKAGIIDSAGVLKIKGIPYAFLF